MEALLVADLKGLRLIKLKTMLDGGYWPDEVEPLHLIWSNHVLPPTCSRLIDRHSKPLDPSEPGFSYPADGCYLEAGPVASLEYESLNEKEFDIGITFENFGGKWDCYHRIVYSQRATELLQTLMGDLELRPVILTGEQVDAGKPDPVAS